jgi:ribonucleoside-diphosphate reductase alpha chain
MANSNKKNKGLTVWSQVHERRCKPIRSCLSTTIRTSVIKNPTGEVVFEMNNVEVPKQWSQIATDILAQKYFRKAGVPQARWNFGKRNKC